MRLQRFRDFEDGATISAMGYDIVIQRRNIGELWMPTGELVACDPFHGLETEPFETELEPGSYPVTLFAAELRDETLCAYAMLEVAEGDSLRWEVGRVAGDSDGSRQFGSPGYPVDSSVGSFMDTASAKALMDYSHAVMEDEDDYRRALRGRVRERLKSGYGWANLNLKYDARVPKADDQLNMVAFDAGYGPGLYSTYFGWNESDELARVVTDFEVLDLRFTSFRVPG